MKKWFLLVLFCTVIFIAGFVAGFDAARTNSFPFPDLIPAINSAASAPTTVISRSLPATQEPKATATPKPTRKQSSTVTKKPSPTATKAPEYVTYIVNKKTKKFHKVTCPSVKQMIDENKLAVTSYHEKMISDGYIPCGRCNP